MKNHKVEDLPGVGRSMAHRLHSLGINTCVEMQQACKYEVSDGHAISITCFLNS